MPRFTNEIITLLGVSPQIFRARPNRVISRNTTMRNVHLLSRGAPKIQRAGIHDYRHGIGNRGRIGGKTNCRNRNGTGQNGKAKKYLVQLMRRIMHEDTAKSSLRFLTDAQTRHVRERQLSISKSDTIGAISRP